MGVRQGFRVEGLWSSGLGPGSSTKKECNGRSFFGVVFFFFLTFFCTNRKNVIVGPVLVLFF